MRFPAGGKSLNSFERVYLNWRNRRKLSSRGRHPNVAYPYFNVEGHVELGDYTHFRNNPTFRTHGDGKIIIHTRSGCSWGCLFEAHERIEVESYVGIAEYCHITDTLFDFSGHTGGFRDAPRITRPVIIRERAFIGSGSFIGPGVEIGKNAVISPHSVVLQSVGELEIWAGAPARKVGHRTEGVPEAMLAASRELMQAQGIRLDRYIQKGERRGLGKLLNWTRRLG